MGDGGGDRGTNGPDSVHVQWAEDVLDFSSQYGSETSISYTAGNLAGMSNLYPKYGDFTEAFVLRTYGPWWEMAPSSVKPLKKTPASFISQDFVELSFMEPVYPTKIEIFETYHPGGVVRILACDGSSSVDGPQSNSCRWQTLWSGSTQTPPPAARIFSPPINPTSSPVNIIRLEFNHKHLEYYLELDAVRLHGLPAKRKNSSNANYNSLPQHLDQLSLDSKPGTGGTGNGHFDCLPEEVINLILSYLDLVSLCRLSCVCRLFAQHCHDPLLYTELNLQPYWDKVTDNALIGLQSRCKAIQKLDLSWCGGYGDISPQTFCSFINEIGTTLICLRLGNCRFMNTECLKKLVTLCTNLQELDLRCNRKIDNIGFLQLTKLTSLRHLNLYRTAVDFPSIVAIIRSCPDLQYLNLGSCTSCNNYDQVAAELGAHCRDLRGLDLWRARTITGTGIRAIANGCPMLEELDIGWCAKVFSESGAIVELLQKCRQLRKLFMTANRSLSDQDLDAVAQYCTKMEQLDILGTRGVSARTAQRVLENCPNMRMFDVSFCAGINGQHLQSWAEQFPHVQVKRSFQSSGS